MNLPRWTVPGDDEWRSVPTWLKVLILMAIPPAAACHIFYDFLTWYLEGYN